MNCAIEIKNLQKKYTNFQLGKLDLTIPNGMIIGLIGENGAGKTTLLKSILNIISIDSGEIKIFDKELLKNETSIKEEIGVVLDNMFFPELLTVKDVNTVMKDVFKNWDSNLFQNYVKTFELPPKNQIKTLSKGMRKKLEIATALSHHPKLLILDEPTSGLDPVVRSEILDIFLDFIQDEEHTILLSTHITTDLEHVADDIVFMDNGNIVFHQTRDDLLEDYGVLKCDISDFSKIDKQDIIKYRKTKYSYEILIKNKEKMIQKYTGFVIDKITLEDLMVIYIKGVSE